MECYSAMKNSETMSFAATWIDIEMVILQKVRERQIPCNITYTWNLKYDTDEPICEIETDS